MILDRGQPFDGTIDHPDGEHASTRAHQLRGTLGLVRLRILIVCVALAFGCPSDSASSVGIYNAADDDEAIRFVTSQDGLAEVDLPTLSSVSIVGTQPSNVERGARAAYRLDISS